MLDKLPKRIQPSAKDALHQIWMADTREHASQAFDLFLKAYEAKYPGACECLNKDRDELLTFYDFPAEHWKHLRTTNPIESTFATVRLRTKKTKGSGSRTQVLSYVDYYHECRPHQGIGNVLLPKSGEKPSGDPPDTFAA